MKRRKVYYALDNLSVAIDLLQATTDYYKQMESVLLISMKIIF